ncbi:MAG: phosphopantetheine-binding protein [Opitutales bacterium]|nr:phosphopantetheine-binding protein [Opitutales bacterium]
MRELEETLDILQEDTLTPETRFRELPGWDSLASLTTLSVFDEIFSHQVSGEELKNCETLGELISLAPEEKGQ